jgi:hypothetical protein
VLADLLGVLGIIVAAPMLATIVLFGRYTMRKMLDQDPWPELEVEPAPLFTRERVLARIHKTLSLLPFIKLKTPSDTGSTTLPDEDQPEGEE